MTLFSKRLKSYREKLKQTNSKWTQKYVADKVGVARVTYTAYENDTKMPPFDTINKIADLFEVKTDYLMGRTDNPKKSDNDKRNAVIDKIASEYPDADLMFDNLANFNAEQLEEVYEFIKFKSRKKQ